MSLFDYAIEKCKETPHKRGYSRHFCVISTKKGKIVSEGRNSYYKTNPIVARASKKLVSLKNNVFVLRWLLYFVIGTEKDTGLQLLGSIRQTILALASLALRALRC